MTVSTSKILDQAMALNAAERLELATEILVSVEGDFDDGEHGASETDESWDDASSQTPAVWC